MSNILYYPVDENQTQWEGYTMNNMTNIYSNIEYNIELNKNEDNENMIILKDNLLKILQGDNNEIIKEEYDITIDYQNEIVEQNDTEINEENNDDEINLIDESINETEKGKNLLLEFKKFLKKFKNEYHTIQEEFIEIDNKLNNEFKKTTEQIKNLDHMIEFTNKIDEKYKNDILMKEIIKNMNHLTKKIEINNSLKEAKMKYIKKRIEIHKYLDIIKSLNNLNVCNICPLCLTNKIEVYIQPCGHCSCLSCKNRLLQYEGNIDNANCFICRKKINNFNTIFLS